MISKFSCGTKKPVQKKLKKKLSSEDRHIRNHVIWGSLLRIWEIIAQITYLERNHTYLQYIHMYMEIKYRSLKYGAPLNRFLRIPTRATLLSYSFINSLLNPLLCSVNIFSSVLNPTHPSALLTHIHFM